MSSTPPQIYPNRLFLYLLNLPAYKICDIQSILILSVIIIVIFILINELIFNIPYYIRCRHKDTFPRLASWQRNSEKWPSRLFIATGRPPAARAYLSTRRRARCGHAVIQAPHWMHLPESVITFQSSKRNVLVGHIETQAPQ